MSFYNERHIAFYYALAETFSIDDRYFCSVLGPTFPNRSYLMAATSFGHLTTGETVPQGHRSSCTNRSLVRYSTNLMPTAFRRPTIL